MTNLRHIVLFQTRDDVTPLRVDAAVAQLAQLADLPTVRTLAVGRDISDRGDFQVGLTADFATHDDLAAYLEHPAHQSVVEILPDVFVKPWQVLDFWTTPPGTGRNDNSGN